MTVSPIDYLLPLFKILFILEYHFVLLNFFVGDLVFKNAELSVLCSVINVLMSDVFPG
jgi:hypothetical protein